jgi:hypothetical protein
MSREKVRWVFNDEGLVLTHVSDYATYFDAFYEYTKNLEEAKAKNITVEFLYNKRTILVYGDSKGLSTYDLEEIRKSAGKSLKGSDHHGIGMMGFMKFAKKMTVVSLKDGTFNILSCYGENDGIYSDGYACEVTNDDAPYEEYYRKLRKYGEGTISILEGVGLSKSNRFDNAFDMKKEFDEKDFIKALQKKCGFSLQDHAYVLKTDLSTDKKGKKIAPKVGTGKGVNFTVPSAAHPAEEIPGSNKDTFVFNDRLCQLKVQFKMFVGLSNDGMVQVSQNRQNGLLFSDAIRMKISNDSVFKSPDYTKYLNGLIDFKVIPLEGDEPINVYTGTRSVLSMDSPFGDCLANILTYADREVLRPAIEKLEKRSDSRVNELRSQNLQKYMEMLFRERKNLIHDLHVAQNTGPVPGSNYVECPRCGLKVPPKRGHKSTDTIIYQRNIIYCFEDVPLYRCGGCGNKWAKRTYQPNPNPNPSTPLYTAPDPDDAQERQRKRGHGYKYAVRPFDQGDNRISAVMNSEIRINTNHVFYRSIEKGKSKDVLTLFECVMAMEAITNHDLSDTSRNVYAERLQGAIAETIDWFNTSKHRVSASDLEKLHQEDADKAPQAPAPIKPAVPVTPIVLQRRPVKPAHSLEDLKNKWGAKK